jgi:phosphatidylglycerophosphatase A
MRSINFLVSTFFGIGKMPFAPGTWASVAAAFPFWFLVDKPLVLLAILVVIYFGGVYFTTPYEKQTGEGH